MLKTLFGKKSDAASKNPLAAEAPTQMTPTATPPVATPQGAGDPPVAEHLETAILNNARADNTETRKAVFQELLFSDLLLALAEPDANAAPETQETGGNVSVALMTNAQGVHFAAAFTSAVAARRWRAEGGQYVGMRGQDVFKMLEQSPAEVIVINAGSAPFIVLTKADYKQLALGVVPQNQHSPVQVPPPGETDNEQQAQGEAGASQEGQVQIAFPPDVLAEEQKAAALAVLNAEENVDACSLGAILPPGADEKSGWIRTLFLRVSGIEETQESMQGYCAQVREKILSNKDLFPEMHIEVGVMPDPNFWVAMHANKVILFDKNPPAEATQPSN